MLRMSVKLARVTRVVLPNDLTEYRQRHPVGTGSEAVNDNGIFMRKI